MREILFRGKRLDNGKWVQGFLVIWGNDYYIAPDINAYTSMGGRGKGRCMMFGHYYQVLPETVGQFTGLPDKNGKKIFEWDIVKTKFGRICKVIFFQSPCYCGIDLIPLEDKHKCPDKFDLYLSDNLEIIGNIHDNPELLEVTE